MKGYIIYDDKFYAYNIYINFLKTFDTDKIFSYHLITEKSIWQQLNIKEIDSDLGLIFILNENINIKYKGSEAIEKITENIPNGNLFADFYKNIPGLKSLTDEAYRNYKNKFNLMNYFKQDFLKASITEEKYNQIKLGMTLEEVQKIIGSEGQVSTSRVGDQIKKQVIWMNFKDHKTISIVCESDKVTKKYASGF